MRAIVARCLLAGTFALAMTLPVELKAQNTGEANAGKHSASQANRDTQSTEKDKKSPAYQAGYREGQHDRSDNLRPRPRDQNWTSDADRRAHDSGYHAGFCAEEEEKTGYYNGTYSSSGPPVVRNGYYGYNAPNPECVSKSSHGH